MILYAQHIQYNGAIIHVYTYTIYAICACCVCMYKLLSFKCQFIYTYSTCTIQYTLHIHLNVILSLDWSPFSPRHKSRWGFWTWTLWWTKEEISDCITTTHNA